MGKMHISASPTADAWLDMLGRLPPAIDIDGLARMTGAIRRSRGVSDGSDLLRLALAHGPGA